MMSTTQKQQAYKHRLARLHEHRESLELIAYAAAAEVVALDQKLAQKLALKLAQKLARQSDQSSDQTLTAQATADDDSAHSAHTELLLLRNTAHNTWLNCQAKLKRINAMLHRHA